MDSPITSGARQKVLVSAQRNRPDVPLAVVGNGWDLPLEFVFFSIGVQPPDLDIAAEADRGKDVACLGAAGGGEVVAAEFVGVGDGLGEGVGWGGGVVDAEGGGA